MAIAANNLYSQKLSIHYSATYNGDAYRNILYVLDSISRWEGLPNPESSDNAAELMIKNFNSKNLQYIDYVFHKSFNVEDSLHPMEWILTNETKDILNYTCKGARTVFRGREYIAYYTNSIPFSIGPWKFGGLPGAILEVASTDGQYQFRSTQITLDDTVDTKMSDTVLHDLMSWTQYCQYFRISVDNYASFMRSSNIAPGGTVQLKIDRPEMIYPRAQSGSGMGTE